MAMQLFHRLPKKVRVDSTLQLGMNLKSQYTYVGEGKQLSITYLVSNVYFP